MDDLLPDTMYEVRVRFVNGAGKSEFSQPSHRAKTNKASLPETCAAPSVDKVGEGFVVLAVTIPPEGGAPVKHFHLEGMSLDDNSTVAAKVTRSDTDVSGDVALYRLASLKLGNSYVFRVKAESAVGFGQFSGWTKEILIPAPDDGRRSGGSSVLTTSK